jgi:hypothetical protein
MFNVEYRTIGSAGRVHPSRFLSIGPQKAQSIEGAVDYAIRKLGRNVEVISATFVGSL